MCTICAGWCVQVEARGTLCNHFLSSTFLWIPEIELRLPGKCHFCGVVSSAYIKSFPVLIFEVVVVVVTTKSGREALGLSSSTANDQNNQRVLVSATCLKAWSLPFCVLIFIIISPTKIP